MNEEFSFLPARRTAAKMKIALIGASGSGKTYSALLLAKGLVEEWKKVGIIDTENNSATLYAHLGDFLHLNLRAPFSPERYIKAIEAAEKAGIEALIIDSVSHEWDGEGGCLEINERISREKFGGNTWSAWSYTGALHARFVQKFLQADMHVIACVRAKTETAIEGKKVIRVGTKEVQRDGFEYEFATVFYLDKDAHEARATKDRTGLFPSSVSFLISEKTGQIIRDWASQSDATIDEGDRRFARNIAEVAQIASDFLGNDPRFELAKTVSALSKGDAVVKTGQSVSLAIVEKLAQAFPNDADKLEKMKAFAQTIGGEEDFERVKRMLQHYVSTPQR